jgi:hypothetical protein
MTSARLRLDSKTRPLVAVLCSVPLLGEAMSSALEFAEVRTFAASGGDVEGLLGWLRPAALIVDTEVGAEAAMTYAREHDLPLIHVSLRDRTLRRYRGGVWEQVSEGEGPTPEGIRNVVAGSLFARAEPIA